MRNPQINLSKDTRTKFNGIKFNGLFNPSLKLKKKKWFGMNVVTVTSFVWVEQICGIWNEKGDLSQIVSSSGP